jgi:hypothetical protein
VASPAGLPTLPTLPAAGLVPPVGLKLFTNADGLADDSRSAAGLPVAFPVATALLIAFACPPEEGVPRASDKVELDAATPFSPGLGAVLWLSEVLAALCVDTAGLASAPFANASLFVHTWCWSAVEPVPGDDALGNAEGSSEPEDGRWRG